MLTKGKTVQTAGFMVVAVLTSKIFGMLRDVLLAGNYGTGPEATAFLSASRIPVLFFDLGLGAAISSVFIPVFNEYLGAGKRKKAFEFSNNFLNMVLVITSVMTMTGIVFAGFFVNMIAAGFDKETTALTIQLVRILFPVIIFTGTAFTFVGILQSFDEFNIPAIISLVSNIIIVLYLVFLNDKFGIYGVAVAMIAGWMTQAFIQVPALIKKGYRYRFILNFKSRAVKKAGMLAIPILISTWVQPVNAMVNIRLASYLHSGSAVPALDYANRLYIIIVGVFTYALSNLIFPSLSRISASENHERFISIINSALRVIFYFITPLMAGFIILRYPIIQLIYERGAFGTFSTGLTSKALLFYSMGMLAFAIQEILNKAFYASHNARTPMKIALGGITLNIILSIILVKFMGIAGLALAASIAAVVIAIMLITVLQKRNKGIINKKIFIVLLKVVTATIIMGIIVFAVHIKLDTLLGNGSVFTKVIHVAVPGLTGIAVYFPLTLIMGIDEAKLPLRLIKTKGN